MGQINWGGLGWGVALQRLRGPLDPNDPALRKARPPANILGMSAFVTWFGVFLVVETAREDLVAALHMEDTASWEMLYALLIGIVALSVCNWIWSQRPSVGKKWFLRAVSSVAPIVLVTTSVVAKATA